MDQIGTKPPKSGQSKTKYKSNSTFFSSPTRRREYTIHPDWVSESLSAQDVPDAKKLPPKQNKRIKSATLPWRRSRTPDPITWRDWPTKESTRPVLQTQKVDLNNSFDKLGMKQDENVKRKNYAFEGTCFSSMRTGSKPFFTIHPEWVSESFSVRGVSLQSKRNVGRPNSASPYMEHRRCKSAPPPRSRNPITWEYC